MFFRLLIRSTFQVQIRIVWQMEIEDVIGLEPYGCNKDFRKTGLNVEEGSGSDRSKNTGTKGEIPSAPLKALDLLILFMILIRRS